MRTNEAEDDEMTAWRRESAWEQVLDVVVVASTCLILCAMMLLLAMGLVFGLVAWVKFAWKYA